MTKAGKNTESKHIFYNKLHLGSEHGKFLKHPNFYSYLGFLEVFESSSLDIAGHWCSLSVQAFFLVKPLNG